MEVFEKNNPKSLSQKQNNETLGAVNTIAINAVIRLRVVLAQTGHLEEYIFQGIKHLSPLWD